MLEQAKNARRAVRGQYTNGPSRCPGGRSHGWDPPAVRNLVLEPRV